VEHGIISVERHSLSSISASDRGNNEMLAIITSSGLSKGFTRFHRALKPSLSVRPFSERLLFEIEQGKRENGHKLDLVAYAAAETTSKRRSRTTGDVLEEDNSSSMVSRNLRDVHCAMNTSDELWSMIAHN